MTDNELLVFCTVYENQSVSKAAEILFCREASISRIIKSLETHYKTRFFDRSNRRMVPTTAGDDFYHSAKRIVDELKIVERMYLSHIPKRSTIRIGTIPYFATTVLYPENLLYQDSNDTLYQLISHDKHTLDNLIENEDLDIVLSFTPIISPSYRIFRIGSDKVVAVTGAQSTIPDNLSSVELAKYNLFLPTSDKTNRKLVSEYLKKQRIVPSIWVESNSDYFLVEILEKNEGISFMGEKYLSHFSRKKSLRAVRLDGFDVVRDCYLSVKSTLVDKPLVQQLMQRLQEIFN